MKKVIIYVLLSVILTVPIASIIIVAILNQPENEYTEYYADIDYGDLETKKLMISDIEEIQNCSGYFDTDKVSDITITYSDSSDVICMIEEGKYVNVGDTIFLIDGEEYKSEYEGVVDSIMQGMRRTIIRLRAPQVTFLRVGSDVLNYSNAKNSYVTFAYDNKEFELKYMGSNSSVDVSINKFDVYYAISDNDFVLDGRIDVILHTGKVKENALVAPRQCIFIDENGGYYIEILDYTNGVTKSNISLGIIGEENVEIIPEKDSLKEGMELVVNSVDVLQKTEKNNDATTEEDE